MAKNNNFNSIGQAPIGSIARFDFTALDGWLSCDGSTVSQSTYDELYDVVGQEYYAEGTAVLTDVTHIHGVAGNLSGLNVKWHPSSNYVAMVGNNTNKELAVYSFNGTTLTEVETIDLDTTSYYCSWHPNGNFLAVSLYTYHVVNVYSWNGTDTLSQVESIDTTYGAYGVSWHPNGNFLAVGHASGGTDELSVYSWNGSDTLTQVETINLDATINVLWSPNGNHLAVGSGLTNNQLKVYSWNGSDTLALVDTYDYGSGPWITGLSWSPDGTYIAFGGSSDSEQIVVCSFNGTTLTRTAGIDYGTSLRGKTRFSNGGKYLLAGYFNGGSTLDCISIYELNYTTGALSAAVDTLSMTKFGLGGISFNYTNNYIAYCSSQDADSTGLLFTATTGLNALDESTNFKLPTVVDNLIRGK